MIAFSSAKFILNILDHIMYPGGPGQALTRSGHNPYGDGHFTADCRVYMDRVPLNRLAFEWIPLKHRGFKEAP